VWLLWYALRIGMDYEAAMRQPTGRIRLLIAIEQVKTEGARFVDLRPYDPATMDLDEELGY
jgi:hypothetical protein